MLLPISRKDCCPTAVVRRAAEVGSVSQIPPAVTQAVCAYQGIALRPTLSMRRHYLGSASQAPPANF
eukprot:1149979-Pelagomonas_calceolata.AAC.3